MAWTKYEAVSGVSTWPGLAPRYCLRANAGLYCCMSIALLIVLFAVLFLVFVSLILFVVGPSLLLQPYRRTIDYYRRYTSLLHPSQLPYRHEEFTLATAEGIPLSCWLLHPLREPRGTVLYLHGVSESKISGLPMADLLCGAGFLVMLYDARRHGDSGGRFCTYGFYEKHDAGTIISYLKSRADLRLGRIGLFGTSMGAAVALQVAATDPRVAAVVAESGFDRLRSVFDDYQRRMIKLPFHYLRNIVIMRSEQLAHFKASAVSPADSVGRIRIPLLLMHGTADPLIRPSYSHQVFERANEPKELWMIQGATHSNTFQVGGDEYRRIVAGFFERTLA